jgi:hypothetical protein
MIWELIIDMDLLTSNILPLSKVMSHLYWHVNWIKCTTYHLPKKDTPRVDCNECQMKGKIRWWRDRCEFRFFQEEQTKCPISISVGQNFNWESLVIEQHQYCMGTKDRLSTRTYVENQDGEIIKELEDFKLKDKTNMSLICKN